MTSDSKLASHAGLNIFVLAVISFRREYGKISISIVLYIMTVCERVYTSLTNEMLNFLSCGTCILLYVAYNK